MATKAKAKTKRAVRPVRPAPKARVRQTTVKEAIEFLSVPSLDKDQPFRRVITAIRDPLNSKILKTIVIHE